MSKAASIYINPLTDFGFKFLFGQEGNKDLLLSFLNAVFQGKRIITDVEFVDKERISENKNDRALIYDVHCKTADGDKLIIEMQNRYQTHFRDRALFYLSGDLFLQGKKGDEWDYSLTPVCGIFLMNFDWREGNGEPMREDACLMNTRTHEIFTDKLWMTFIKVPMMDKDAEDCRDTLERWIYLLKNMDKMEAMPKVFMNDPVFRKLGKVARVAALSSAERSAYDASLKSYRDSYSIAKTERTEGFNEGMEKGIAEGREEERMESIRFMLSVGIAPEVIAAQYNMTVDDVFNSSLILE